MSNALRLASALTLAAAATAAAPRAAHAADACTPARAMIVLDKSSSMTQTIGGQSKWSIAKGALDGVATMFENKIDLGLMVFPNPDECGPGTVNVDVGPGHREAIMGSLGAAPPTLGNYTPMAQTLDAAYDVPSLQDPTRSRYVVLISDGWQWCYPYDPSTRFDAVDAVARLRAQGVVVYVVGFGDSVDALALNQMAAAGGTAQPGCDVNGDFPGAPAPCYYQADNPAELNSALQEIAVQVSTETCDGLDNDCDGLVDEDLARECTTACGNGTETCTAGQWSGCDAPPVVTEVCDGTDNDCDGTVDPGCACTAGDTRACGEDEGACQAGVQSCGLDGMWGECAGAVGPASEMCNGLDDDCDGVVDGTMRTEGDDAGQGALLCPSGQTCEGGLCVDVSEPPTPPASEDGGGFPAGCGCRAGGTSGAGGGTAGGLHAGLTLAGVMLVGRRRRR